MEKNRGLFRKKWVEEHGLKAVLSMKRRKVGHDYCGVCMYMVTVCVLDRRPLLAYLRDADGAHERPWVELSDLGQIVNNQWQRLYEKFPQVRTLWLQVMPDHIHGIVYVTQRLNRPLGHVVSYFKARCTAAMRDLSQCSETQSRSTLQLWETGFNDRILHGKGQLDRWINYLMDNPRRLWIKRYHRDWFTAKRGTTIGTTAVTTMGNEFLLDWPMKVQVQCSRRLSNQEISEFGDRIMEQAANGAVAVSPCISPGEKVVMKRLFEAGYPQIILLENGFSPIDKPQGRQFDACAEGRILLIAPWEHHNERRLISRAQCLALNNLAAEIVAGHVTQQ